MKRRALLAGTGLTAAVLAGCLRGDVGERDDVEYERCGDRVVYLRALPDPAEDEAVAAIEDGEYETDGDPVLAEVIDVDDTYLKYTDGDGGDYYAVELEEDGNVTRLRAEETNPPARETIPLSNDTKDELTVDVYIEYETEGEVLVDETVELEPGERVEFDGDGDYRYGSYRAEITVVLDGVERSDEVRWRFDYPPIDISLGVTVDRDADEFRVAVTEGYGDPDGCEWNDDGTLTNES